MSRVASLPLENVQPTVARGRLADYWELSKPRIVALEIVVVAVCAVVAGLSAAEIPVLLHALVGVGLAAASAAMLNNCLEREVDARMPRTADRAIAAGRVSATEVAVVALGMAAVAAIYLSLFTPVGCVAGVAASWLLYVGVYTPLKTRSAWNTWVGAAAGAAPVVAGWAAVGDVRAFGCWALFLLLFLWQFPHFMAIAWLHRRDYAAGAMQMLTVVDPSGLRAGAQAALGAALVVPVSVAPLLEPRSPAIYAVVIAVAGALQLVAAVRFFCRRDEATARTLLRASLLYLPAVLMFLALARLH